MRAVFHPPASITSAVQPGRFEPARHLLPRERDDALAMSSRNAAATPRRAAILLRRRPPWNASPRDGDVDRADPPAKVSP